VSASPLAYRASQAVFAPGAQRSLTDALRAWSRRHDAGELVLDAGCGPRSWLRTVGVRPVGVDRSPAAIRTFHRSSEAGVVASATALPFRTGALDSAWCFGLLHHLPDADAATAVRELQRVTKPGGHVVVFDGIHPGSGGPPLARVIRRLDRGRWMRTRAGLTALLDRGGVWDHEPLRYSALGLDGVLATWTRAA